MSLASVIRSEQVLLATANDRYKFFLKKGCGRNYPPILRSVHV
jgi:hypothetical protein